MKKTREKAMELMQKAIIFADKMGIRTIQMAGYDVYMKMEANRQRKYFIVKFEKSCRMGIFV